MKTKKAKRGGDGDTSQTPSCSIPPRFLLQDRRRLLRREQSKAPLALDALPRELVVGREAGRVRRQSRLVADVFLFDFRFLREFSWLRVVSSSVSERKRVGGGRGGGGRERGGECSRGGGKRGPKGAR